MKPTAQEFECWIERLPISGCWIWLRAISNNRYGCAWVEGKWLRAHRLSYQIYKGEIPDTMYVLHRCDVMLCVNPDHLYLGTAGDNQGDILQRGNVKYFNSEKLTCIQGHILTEDNLHIRPNGARTCRICQKKWSQDARDRKLGKAI